MAGFVDWFGPLLAATLFLGLGVTKVIGLRRGFVGGRGKPLFQYACGSCPGWRSRIARVALPVMLMAVGFVNLVLAVLALGG